jgi:hypothetical protein
LPAGLENDCCSEETTYLTAVMLPQSKLSTGKFPKEITDFLLALQKSHDRISTFTEQYLQASNGHKPPEKIKRQSCQKIIFSY